MPTDTSDAKRHYEITKQRVQAELKEQQRTALIKKKSYRMINAIALLFDRYFLDPVIGLFFPGFGDVGCASYPFHIFLACARTFCAIDGGRCLQCHERCADRVHPLLCGRCNRCIPQKLQCQYGID